MFHIIMYGLNSNFTYTYIGIVFYVENFHKQQIKTIELYFLKYFSLYTIPDTTLMSNYK